MANTVWRGQLTFGLVSFPVRLHIAARKERVRMHYLRQAPSRVEQPAQEPEEENDPDQRAMRIEPGPAAAREQVEPPLPVTRIKQEFLSDSDERPVPRQDLVRGYQIAPEQYVTFTNEELRSLRPATSPDMQILRSVRLADIDPVYFETSYFVVPDKGGERAYALLFAALQKTQYVAIAKVAMHGREHIIVVRPGQKGLLAHTMYYNDEIRSVNEFQTNVGEVAPKELELATTFVDAIAGPFAPEEFKDTYRENVQKLVSSKQERQQVAVSSPTPQPDAAPVVNILDALKKSLEIAKKPAKTEAPPSRRAPGKVTELKSKAQRRKG
jgi:DNA end-binding protein Ku